MAECVWAQSFRKTMTAQCGTKLNGNRVALTWATHSKLLVVSFDNFGGVNMAIDTKGAAWSEHSTLYALRQGPP